MARNDETRSRVLLNNADEFGAYIRSARKRAGMTQTALASQVDVSRKWLSEVENGKATAEIGLVLAVVRQFGAVIHAEQAPTLVG